MNRATTLKLSLPSSDLDGRIRLPVWPPPADYPIVVDSNGETVSRYGDSIWNLWPVAGRNALINFGDGVDRRGTRPLSRENAALLRKIVAWWIFGPRGPGKASTLVRQAGEIRRVLAICTAHGVAASDLESHPSLIDEIAASVSGSWAQSLLLHLHLLYESRQILGFFILGPAGLRRLRSAMPAHARRQTPYIPARIWLYQLERLNGFLSDFIEHKERITECFDFCLRAYAQNFGSTPHNNSGLGRAHRTPFGRPRSGRYTGSLFHGPFGDTAAKFGIADLLDRWIEPTAVGVRVSSFASYLSMTAYVSLAYLLNVSLMRIDEAWRLRLDCFMTEPDDAIGAIYMLRGTTSKTVEDDDARWIVPAHAQVAVEAATCVAKLRSSVAILNPAVPIQETDARNPYLFQKAYEPWATTRGATEPSSVRPAAPSYAQLLEYYPRLFDANQLRITGVDLSVARILNPDLDSDKFAVGKVWPLAWHQLRRTGAVNMQASGTVSDASVQYQLKHATRAMTLYYGQGRSSVVFNRSAQAEYLTAMYDLLSHDMARLSSERWVSPYGERHKADALRLVSTSDSARLVNLAKQGQVSWRETLLGGCMSREPCPYGGIDNLVRCMGSDGRPPCANALVDREREASLRRLASLLDTQLREAPSQLLRESLDAQRRAVDAAISYLAK